MIIVARFFEAFEEGISSSRMHIVCLTEDNVLRGGLFAADEVDDVANLVGADGRAGGFFAVFVTVRGLNDIGTIKGERSVRRNSEDGEIGLGGDGGDLGDVVKEHFREFS